MASRLFSGEWSSDNCQLHGGVTPPCLVGESSPPLDTTDRRATRTEMTLPPDVGVDSSLTWKPPTSASGWLVAMAYHFLNRRRLLRHHAATRFCRRHHRRQWSFSSRWARHPLQPESYEVGAQGPGLLETCMHARVEGPIPMGLT